MSWIISDKTDLSDIVNFLLVEEWKNVQALSEFCSNSGYKYPSKSTSITIINTDKKDILGMVVITSRGLIFPIINEILLDDNLQKENLIKIFSQIKFKIHGVIGLKKAVNYLDEIIFRTIRGSINYKIMHRTSRALFKLEESFKIKKASIKDTNKLIALEYEYQKEEVLLDSKDLNKKATLENFKNKLKNDDIYYLSLGNFPISKGGTSYKSTNYSLLGGIFTWKEKRNNGFSTNLLKYIINDQLRNGHYCALFVKESNIPAIHLYEKLGFKNSLEYKINYYN